MFDIGPSELILIFIVALLVIGPEKLPSAIRTASLWVGRFRRSFHKIKAEVERELNTDEIKRQLHNESILEEVEKAKSSVNNFAKDIEQVAADVGKDSDDQSDSSLTPKTPSATTEPQSKQNNNASGEPSDTKAEQKKEDNPIASGLKQTVSYVNDISRDVKQSAKEIKSEFESTESAKKPEPGDKK